LEKASVSNDKPKVPDENELLQQGKLSPNAFDGTRRVEGIHLVDSKMRKIGEPSDVPAERALLGAFLWAASNAPDALRASAVQDLLPNGEPFYDRSHGDIYEAALACLAKDDETGHTAVEHDPVAVAAHAAKLGKGRDATGIEALLKLQAAASTVSEVQARAYADSIRSAWAKRCAIRDLRVIVSDALRPEMNDVAIFERAQKAALDIMERSAARATTVSIRQSAEQVFKDMLAPGGAAVSTGLRDVDALLNGGLRAPETSILAARTSVGKSTISIGMAEYICASDPLAGVLYVSMEMPHKSFTTKLLASRTVGLTVSAMRRKVFNGNQLKDLKDSVDAIKDLELHFTVSMTQTLASVFAAANERQRVLKKAGKRLVLVIVDHIGLVKASNELLKRATRQQQVAETSRGLRWIASEIGCHVMALAQIHRDAERQKSSESIPKLHHLRECVTGDTRVLLTDGSRPPIRDLVGRKPEVWAMTADQKLVAATADEVWSVGRRRILEITLATGRIVRVTPKHRLYGADGWTRAGGLKTGDRLAIARHVRIGDTADRWPMEHLALLAHMIGDGSYVKHQPMRYTTGSEENSTAVRYSAERHFGSTVNRVEGRGNWHQLVISGNGSRWHPAGVGLWLKELGVYGQRSHEKHVPDVVFCLSDEQIGYFLRHFWATDGTVSDVRGTQPNISCSTSSRRLADDVSALLLRLGIVTRVRTVHGPIGRPWYNVCVSGSEQQLRFLDVVGTFGPRVAGGQVVRARLERVVKNTNVDTLPQAVFAHVRAAMRAGGITTRRMSEMRKTSYGGSSHFGFSPSRATMSEYASLLNDPALRMFSESDLFWDRVVSVTDVGTAEVYDMSVPGYHSWLADGIVSHNSGDIEQDADQIFILHRPRDPSTGLIVKGKPAALVLAKSRLDEETMGMLVDFQRGRYVDWTDTRRTFASEYESRDDAPAASGSSYGSRPPSRAPSRSAPPPGRFDDGPDEPTDTSLPSAAVPIQPPASPMQQVPLIEETEGGGDD
jgi:replicative DNA helicase